MGQGYTDEKSKFDDALMPLAERYIGSQLKTSRQDDFAPNAKRSNSRVRFLTHRSDDLWEAVYVHRDYLPDMGWLIGLDFCVSLLQECPSMRDAFTYYAAISDVVTDADSDSLYDRLWSGEWFRAGERPDDLPEAIEFFFHLFTKYGRSFLEASARDLDSDPLLKAARAHLPPLWSGAVEDSDDLGAELETIAPSTKQGYPVRTFASSIYTVQKRYAKRR